jgi:hypothetical protein
MIPGFGAGHRRIEVDAIFDLRRRTRAKVYRNSIASTCTILVSFSLALNAGVKIHNSFTRESDATLVFLKDQIWYKYKFSNDVGPF